MPEHETHNHELSKTLEAERQARATAEARCEQLESELRAAQAAVAAAEDERQAFVSLVTHELRVPMTSIKGYTDLLLKGLMGPVNETQTTFLNTIRSNVERMSRMVADLAEINKLEGGRMPMNVTALEVGTVVEEALQTYRQRIEEKSQNVVIHIPDALPPVQADRMRLIQVLANLIGNAHAYTPEQGTITLTAETEGANAERIRIDVTDDGIGILPEEQARVFEKFFRASDEETRQVTGNGLALHPSRLLVEQQDGSIEFTSVRGEGTTFSVHMPAAAA